jgi:MSHA biogenesis protein MshJ
MKPISERARLLLASIDALSLRERLLVFIALLTIVGGAWQALLATPLADREQRAWMQIEASQGRLDQLGTSIEMAAAGIGVNGTDPDRMLALRTEAARNDEAVRVFTTDLVDPGQMRFVLEDLIRRQSGLELVRAGNTPVSPLLDYEQGGTANDNRPMLYRHGLSLELEGSYLDCLEYLKAVEALPWQLYWSRIRLQTLAHPRIRIAVEIYTLSLDEEWISV